MLYQLCVWVFALATVANVPNPRSSGWVSDQADVLDAATEAKLNEMATLLYSARKVELAVVVVDDVDGTPKQFATALFNHWGIGNAATNSGVLVLLVMAKRRLEIETGTGMEGALPAQWLADMQMDKMVPLFKQKDYGGGLIAGVAAISEHLDAAPLESMVEQMPGEYRDTRSVEVEDESDGLLASGIIGGVALGAAGIWYARRRRRMCERCQPARRMLSLSEVEDDKHLDAGQLKEERIGSVNYEVMICPGCQDSRTLRHGKWFSGYDDCSSCTYKTVVSTSVTLRSATSDCGGEVEITDDCEHCDYRSTYSRYTEKLTSSSGSSSSFSSGSSWSSSSSGSSGSFGGGSSDGGGAGSRW